MDDLTPAQVVEDIEPIDGAVLTANLFRDHPVPVDNGEKLLTYLRIRPITLQSETNRCFKVLSSTNLLAMPPKESATFKNAKRVDNKQQTFTFHHIFDDQTNQEKLYNTCALPMVQRFLRGENCLLFVHGITSSGKSHTMRGTVTEPGIIHRSLVTIFNMIGERALSRPSIKPEKFNDISVLSFDQQELEENIATYVKKSTEEKSSGTINAFTSQMTSLTSNFDLSDYSSMITDISTVGHKYQIWVSFVEFYNEQLFDLLQVSVEGEKKPTLQLWQDGNQNYFVRGLRQIFVASAEDAFKVFLYGQNKLHISATELNHKSSRSHCSFTINLVTIEETTGRCLSVSNFSFCDLAGAERSDKTHNTGQRMQETGKINNSLLALSRCITALRHNQKYPGNQRPIPFRDSKLTKLFKAFLCGNGIAVMIANINPTPDMFDETLVALNFSAVASQVVVSTEEQRRKLQDSLKRLTQVWMQSTQRWSSFARPEGLGKTSFAPSLSAIQRPSMIEEGDENEEDDDSVTADDDMTLEDLEKKVNEITEMDFSKVDQKELELLQNQIEYLTEKLNQANCEKLDMEIKVRQQVASEFRKLANEMEEMAEKKDKARRQAEQIAESRIREIRKTYRKEKQEYEKRITELENELFQVREKMCEQSNRSIIDVSMMKNDLDNQKVQLFEKQLEEERQKRTELETTLANKQTLLNEAIGNEETCSAKMKVLEVEKNELKKELDVMKELNDNLKEQLNQASGKHSQETNEHTAKLNKLDLEIKAFQEKEKRWLEKQMQLEGEYREKLTELEVQYVNQLSEKDEEISNLKNNEINEMNALLDGKMSSLKKETEQLQKIDSWTNTEICTKIDVALSTLTPSLKDVATDIKDLLELVDAEANTEIIAFADKTTDCKSLIKIRNVETSMGLSFVDKALNTVPLQTRNKSTSTSDLIKLHNTGTTMSSNCQVFNSMTSPFKEELKNGVFSVDKAVMTIEGKEVIKKENIRSLLKTGNANNIPEFKAALNELSIESQEKDARIEWFQTTYATLEKEYNELKKEIQEFRASLEVQNSKLSINESNSKVSKKESVDRSIADKKPAKRKKVAYTSDDSSYLSAVGHVSQTTILSVFINNLQCNTFFNIEPQRNKVQC